MAGPEQRFGTHLNLQGSSNLLNATIHPASSAPSPAVDGMIWYDTTSKQYRNYNSGSGVWYQIGTGASGVVADFVSIRGGANRTQQFVLGTGSSLGPSGGTVNANLFLNSAIIGIANGGTNNNDYTVGGPLFYNGSIITNDDTYLHYDYTNHRLAVGVGNWGTSFPSGSLVVGSGSTTMPAFRMTASPLLTGSFTNFIGSIEFVGSGLSYIDDSATRRQIPYIGQSINVFTGPLGVANGGTNNTTYPTGGILYSSGSTIISFNSNRGVVIAGSGAGNYPSGVLPGTSGNALLSNGLTWLSATAPTADLTTTVILSPTTSVRNKIYSTGNITLLNVVGSGALGQTLLSVGDVGQTYFSSSKSAITIGNTVDIQWGSPTGATYDPSPSYIRSYMTDSASVGGSIEIGARGPSGVAASGGSLIMYGYYGGAGGFIYAIGGSGGGSAGIINISAFNGVGAGSLLTCASASASGGTLDLRGLNSIPGGSINLTSLGTSGPGSINMRGNAGGSAGSLTTNASASAAGGGLDLSAATAAGGHVYTYGGTSAGGDIDMYGANMAAGKLQTYGGGGNTDARGGHVQTYGGAGALARGGDIQSYGVSSRGGDVLTYDGGGSINTRGTGIIELGASGTRTTLTGTASTNRVIQFPDTGGLIVVATGTITSAASGQSLVYNGSAWTTVTVEEAGVLGDGSDGDTTLSSNTVLGRSMYYNNLTVVTGVVINVSGFRIHCAATLTNNGLIHANGRTGASTVAGTAGPAGDIGGGGAGGAGGTAAAASGTSVSGIVAASQTGFGGIGGNGGAGGSGTNVFGIGGTSGVLTLRPQRFLSTSFLSGTTQLSGGTGGGGGGAGGGDGVNKGGNGGGGAGGGGLVAIYARSINNTPSGIISVIGGSGVVGAPGAAGNAGGGGGGAGGGGGFVFLVYDSIVNSGVISASGGPGGGSGAKAIGGTGFDGVAGTVGGSGYVLKYNLRSRIFE